MSYLVTSQKFFSAETTNASSQEISTTYTEITGSKCAVSASSTSPDLYYSCNFLIGPWTTASTPSFLHIKLQESNDNFVSDVSDVSGCQLNASGDTTEALDIYRLAIRPVFIVSGFTKTHLRLVARSYSTSTKARLHLTTSYPPDPPGSSYNFYCSRICVEL